MSQAAARFDAVSRNEVKRPSAGADAAATRFMDAPPVGHPGTSMVTTPKPPLTRSVQRDVLDWEGIERRDEARATDVLGLRAEDRFALGMSAPRLVDIAPHVGGDANAALVEALQKGAAYGKAEPRRRK